MISVVIITGSERERIKACIESVKFADEVIVIDCNSDDGTADLAKKEGARVIEYIPKSEEEAHEYYVLKKVDFSKLRNEGLEAAKGDWILYVDADERVLEPLRKELEGIMGSQDAKGAWAISRKNVIFGQNVSYGPYGNDWVIRFFKKDHLKGWKGEVHEQPEFSGDLGHLKNQLLHLTHRNLDQVVLKSLDWSKIDAKLRLNAHHPRMTRWRFFRILITESFHQGIIRKGFFNGEVGMIDSTLQVFSLFMTYVRLWQLQQSEPLEKRYKEIDENLIKNNFRY